MFHFTFPPTTYGSFSTYSLVALPFWRKLHLKVPVFVACASWQPCISVPFRTVSTAWVGKFLAIAKARVEEHEAQGSRFVPSMLSSLLYIREICPAQLPMEPTAQECYEDYRGVLWQVCTQKGVWAVIYTLRARVQRLLNETSMRLGGIFIKIKDERLFRKELWPQFYFNN